MKAMRLFPARAFTLVEMLVGLTIAGFVMAGVLAFYISDLKYSFFAEQKLLINDDVRNVTERMMKYARDSNFVVLYQAFYPYTTVNNAFPYTGNGTDSTNVTNDFNGDGLFTSLDRLPVGSAGDYAVFVYYTDPFANFTPATPNVAAPIPQISRIVAYWIAPNRIYNGNDGQPPETALYTFDTDDYKGTNPTWTTPWGATFPASLNSSSTLETLLPPNTLAWAQNKNFKIVLNDVRGQVTFPVQDPPSQGLNFMYLSGSNQVNEVVTTAILMKSLVLHGNAAKRVTNTYNFTLSPNG